MQSLAKNQETLRYPLPVIHPRYFSGRELQRLWKQCVHIRRLLDADVKVEPFSSETMPLDYLGIYMHCVADEAFERGSDFDRDLIPRIMSPIAHISPLLAPKEIILRDVPNDVEDFYYLNDIFTRGQ